MRRDRISATEQSGRTLTWNYDGIYRLASETVTSDPAGSNGSASYGLDPVGNRQTATSTISGLAPISGTFNADDELASESYDNNGNVTATGGKTFAYDSENHLVSMNSGAVAIVYDGDGNRVAKTVGDVTTKYLVDDLNPTGYPQVIEDVVGGAVQREYTYGLQLVSENQLISGSWTASFYGYDGMGTVSSPTPPVPLPTPTTTTHSVTRSGRPVRRRTITGAAANSTIPIWASASSAPDLTTRRRADSSAAIRIILSLAIQAECRPIRSICTNTSTPTAIQ